MIASIVSFLTKPSSGTTSKVRSCRIFSCYLCFIRKRYYYGSISKTLGFIKALCFNFSQHPFIWAQKSFVSEIKVKTSN